MERVNGNQFQYRLLRLAYKIAPFELKGDYRAQTKDPLPVISCLIIASNRPRELDSLLEDLVAQNLGKEKFEVAVLNDGAGAAVREIVDKYKHRLEILYQENKIPWKVLSNLRNVSLEMARGKYILLLDDDTRITQPDFLFKALQLMDAGGVDILMPHARALFGVVKAKYDFLDAYSMTNRCCIYHREVLEELGGFKKDLNTYEDIELSIRVMIRNFAVFKAPELNYFHPPLYFDSMRKPLSIGQTIFQIKKHYSFLVWVLVYLNALRFLPYAFVPNRICRQWFRISLGVLLYPFSGKSYYY